MKYLRLLLVLLLVSCGSSNYEVDQKKYNTVETTKESVVLENQIIKEKIHVQPTPRPAPMASARPAPAPIGGGSAPAGSGLRSQRLETTAASPINEPPAKPTVSQPSNRQIDRQAEQILKQLTTKANLVFGIPEKANVENKIKAQLIVDISKEIEELAKDLTVRESITKASFNTSKVIRARLVATDFTVTQIEDAEQVVLEGRPAVWNWILEAKDTGELSVTLTVEAKVEINGREKISHIKTFEKVVNIEVTKSQLISDWLAKRWEDLAQWLWSVVLLPLLLWWWKKRPSKRKP